MPRVTSNEREVMLGKVAVPKQIFVLHCKNSCTICVRRFELWFFVLLPQVVIQLSLVQHFSIWATEGLRKNWFLPAGLFWQISAIICICFLLVPFWVLLGNWDFEGSATVACVLMEVLLVLKLNLKTYYLECTNVANKDCVKFCMKKNFRCNGGMM